MTKPTKQKKYDQGLKEKGLTKFRAIVPLSAVDGLREVTDEMRKVHLKGRESEK